MIDPHAIVARLNELVADPDVRADILRLLEARVPASHRTVDHESLVVHDTDGAPALGVLGLLNGLLSSNTTLRICAVYASGAHAPDGCGQFERFEVTIVDPAIYEAGVAAAIEMVTESMNADRSLLTSRIEDLLAAAEQRLVRSDMQMTQWKMPRVKDPYYEVFSEIVSAERGRYAVDHLRVRRDLLSSDGRAAFLNSSGKITIEKSDGEYVFKEHGQVLFQGTERFMDTVPSAPRG